MDPMILSVLYVWCQLNRDTTVNFWFGTQFKAMYLPWVLLAVNMILSNGGMFSVVGIVVGHLYFFLKFKYPQELGGPSYLETPAFLYVINWILSNITTELTSSLFLLENNTFQMRWVVYTDSVYLLYTNRMHRKRIRQMLDYETESSVLEMLGVADRF